MKHRQPFLPKLSLEKYMVNAGSEESNKNDGEDEEEGLDLEERKELGDSKMLGKKWRNKERNNNSLTGS